MKLVVGLGNPGKKYAQTRHNVGWLAVDYYLAGRPTIQCPSKFASEISEWHVEATKIFFVKPQTFMNNSGSAVRELCHFYKAKPETDLLVIHDEIDLPLGTIRLAKDSSAAGHNGVQNIIDELGDMNFARIRIGIDTRASRNDLPTEAFVLQTFTSAELEKLNSDIFPEVNNNINNFLKLKPGS